MDFKQLTTFHAVAELGSLSKAADRLRIAQPALSRQIQLLEHDLRAELFARNGRGMALTGSGRMLLERTAHLVRQFEQVRDDIRSASGVPCGPVVLGLVPTVSTVLSARLAARILTEFPEISLRIVESYGGHHVEWLHKGEMDLAVIYGPATDLHLAVEPIGRDSVVVVGPPGSGLQERGAVELEWVMQQQLVLPSVSHGLRALLERVAMRKNLSLNVLLEADSYRVLTQLVEAGFGYTILPPSSVREELAEGRVESAAITPAVQRELILASPTGQPRTVASATVADSLLSEIRLLVEERLWDIQVAGQ